MSDESMRRIRARDWLPYGFGIIVVHLIGFAALFEAGKTHPAFYGIGLLAYTLGMRHAFDADHIACIDNTVRKLTQQKKNPSGVGFYFSMGHSTVVIIMALITAFAAVWAQDNVPALEAIGGIIGTLISGGFLLLLGILNLVILMGIWKVFKQMRYNNYEPEELETLLQNRGFMNRFVKPLFKFVNESWQIYPVGFLFGLGFDTASEIMLLAIAAGAAKGGISFIGVISLPILFAAGMSLFDTADGIFMTTAYDWAFRTPVRKVYYNLTITGLSVVAALVIGIVELAQVASQELGYTSGFWGWLQNLDFGIIGYFLVGLFALTWIGSYSVWKFGHIEEKMTGTK